MKSSLRTGLALATTAAVGIGSMVHGAEMGFDHADDNAVLNDQTTQCLTAVNQHGGTLRPDQIAACDKPDVIRGVQPDIGFNQKTGAIAVTYIAGRRTENKTLLAVEYGVLDVALSGGVLSAVYMGAKAVKRGRAHKKFMRIVAP